MAPVSSRKGTGFLKSKKVVCKVWNRSGCGERLLGKQKKCEWIGGLSTMGTMFAQPLCGVVWKEWERNGGWDGMEERFPVVRKGTGKF